MKASENNVAQTLRMTSSGFTLIELMVTIAVLAIIVSIAAPSISNQLSNQRVKSTTALIENALKEAKAESLIRRKNISVVYNASDTPRTITLEDSNTPITTISTYVINDKSTVSITPATINRVTFQPNKLIAGDDDIIYSICDSGSNSETLKQVIVNKIANVSTKNSGSC